ncbi:2Fe-2S iron-sulfur cluster-binding protein [Hydrogenophaga sp.]|uniref:2Fe-2S iron-sulfur cluster-binding protein n=1 Tax=Hydrogenophaga sp. TaxID=1904254 RepID=UPI0025C037F3|nr:2Fe-2S iron-sulfur cluster-binding protein [Hydrogenophaga sp.]
MSATHLIHIAGLGTTVPCTEGQTVLDAVRQAGYEMPFSCNSGICASCKGRVVSGRVNPGAAGDHTLSADEIAHGQVLFCQARPLTDIEIEPRQIEKTDPNARRQLDARVMRIDFPAPDVARLKLRFPAGEKVKFKAGQYLQVLLPDGQRRSFSMANPPHQNDGAELHIRLLESGAFSQTLTHALKVGDTLPVELPHGDFFLREDSDAPIVMLASGTGFAPIKSMVEDGLRQGQRREIALYWGARTEKDLYLLDLARGWGQQAGLRFVPVLSEPDAGWTGRIGFVHQAVLQDHDSLAGHQVYACGAPAMVSAARSDFVATRGLPPDAFFCDAFVVAQPRTPALAD